MDAGAGGARASTRSRGPSRGYRNIDIARGAQDRYIMRFARSLARYPGTVWLRYAHEMNGYWYPWSRGARAYRWAWRRIVRLFGVAGADNVRFVWSVNANLYDARGRLAAERTPVLAGRAATSTPSARR